MVFEAYPEGAAGVVVATSANYPDALSISGYAFAADAPIFLTDPASGLSEDTKALIGNGGFSRAIVVGGESAVGEADFAWLDEAAGEGRYDTSELIG